MTVFLGRGSREKVTLVSSFSTIEGPMPLTLNKPSLEPKGPSESRSATIRLAMAGPMCLSDSISASVATSRSTGPGRTTGAFRFFPRFALPAFSGGIGRLQLRFKGGSGVLAGRGAGRIGPVNFRRGPEDKDRGKEQERLPFAGGTHFGTMPCGPRAGASKERQLAAKNCRP